MIQRALTYPFFIAVLGACSLPFTSAPEPKTYYDLHRSEAQPVPEGERAPHHLLVQDVRGTPLLVSRAILFRRQKNTVASYSLGQWSEAVTDQLTTLLLDELRERQAFALVTRSSAGIVGDLQLNSELREFSYDLSGEKPEVRFVVVAELIRLRDRSAISQRVFSKREPVAGEEFAEVMNAFDRITESAVREIAEWIRTSAPSELPPEPAPSIGTPVLTDPIIPQDSGV